MILYEDENAVDLEELDDAIGESSEFQGVFADPDAIEVTQEGRTASITGEVRTDQSTTTATEETPADDGGTLSDLTTYTNETYAYSIEYPANWIVNDTIPQQVEIAPPELDGQLRISVTEGVGDTYTLDELAGLAVSSSRDRMDDFELLDEQDTEIESGQEARVLDFTYDNPNDGADQLRSKYLITLHEGTIYEVEFALVSERYTDEVDRTATDVVESLSLDGNGTTLRLAAPIAHL